jgi:tripartite-type tricarboxylate transporter receptor subunit TctC
MQLNHVVIALISLWDCSMAFAQNYSLRPLRLIVPFAPGGGLDITARLISSKLSESLGKSVVVDNRPGAGGAIGLELTARSNPDGNTMAILSASHLIQDLIGKSRFDLMRDFAPVTEIIATPYVFVVHPALPAKTVSTLVAYAKSNAGKLNYVSAGSGTLQQLSMELFNLAVGIKVLEVPYKGLGPSFPDIFAGRVQMMMSSLAALSPHIRAKLLHAIAVTSSERTGIFPELPTMIEAGVPGFIVNQWQGLVMPAGTPSPIVNRIQSEVLKSLQHRDLALFLSNDGSQPVGSSAQQFKSSLVAERAKWETVISQSGIRTD